MRFLVTGEADEAVNTIMHQGLTAGFEMVSAKDITHDIIETAHAIIYVADKAINDAHEQFNNLVSKMNNHGVKRLVVCTPALTNIHMQNSDLDWTVINPDKDYARMSKDELSAVSSFILDHVTNASGIRKHISFQPIVSA